MQVREVSRCGVWAPHSRFEHVDSPFYVHTDYPWMHGATMWGLNESLVCDYDLQAIYPAPIRVPCHTKLVTTGVPELAPYQSTWNTHTSFGPNTPADYVHVYDPRLPKLDWEVLGQRPFYPPRAEALVVLDDDYDGFGTPLLGSDPNYYFFYLQPLPSLDRDLTLWLMAQGNSHYDRDFAHQFRASNVDLQGATFIQAPQWRYETPETPIKGPFVNVSYRRADGTTAIAPNAYVQYRRPTSYTAESWWANRCVVGSGEDAVTYEVRFDGLGGAKIRKQIGDEGWTEIMSVPPGGNAATTTSNTLGTGLGMDEKAGSRSTQVEFRLVCGRLAVRIGASETPFYFEENRLDSSGKLIDRITALEWAGERIDNFAWTCHPTWWHQNPVYESPEIPTGFASYRVGEPAIHPAGAAFDRWTVEVDSENSDLTGPTVVYQLKFHGPTDFVYRGTTFSRNVEPVRAVDLFWLPVTTYRPTVPAEVFPSEVVISHDFDLNTLQIGSSGELRFGAASHKLLPTGEIGYWGEWMAAQGQTATQVALGRNVPADFIGINGFERNTVFSGYGNVLQEVEVQQGAPWQYVSHLGDRRRQLTERWALPWMDGWNVFYAIAFLAQLGGVSTREMNFINYVPVSPIGSGSDLGSPEGLPAYYLPTGEQGSVLTRQSGVALWDLMSRIAWSIGYMLYFDVFGRLSFHKFFRPYGIKRSFYESDVESYSQPGGGFEGCWSIHSAKDMASVRSEVILAGIRAFGPIYDPIVYKRADDGVVFDDLAFNHLGYRNPSAVVDSLYADEAFAADASYALMTVLRIPDFSVNFTTWLQPDIFPGDMARVQSRRAGTHSIPMMVTGVRHVVNQARGVTAIKGQFVPETFYGA